MTEMQAGLYTHFLTSNAARRLLAGQKAARVLSAITGVPADKRPVCSYQLLRRLRDLAQSSLAEKIVGSAPSQASACCPRSVHSWFDPLCRPARSWHYQALPYSRAAD